MYIEQTNFKLKKTQNVRTLYKTITVDGLSIFYREAGDPANPKIVLLHGFPSSSHQCRNLIPALADHFHVVAPDYPGFGNSDLASPDDFHYTFDQLSEIVEHFLKAVGFTHVGLYMQDSAGQLAFALSIVILTGSIGLSSRTPMHMKLASPKLGMGSVTHYGRIARLRPKNLSVPSWS